MCDGRAIGRVVGLLLGLSLCLPVEAGTLIPGDRVSSELRDLSYRPSTSDASGRYILIRSAFDSLSSAEVIERLNTLARQEAGPDLAWRATLDLARFGRTLGDEDRERFGLVRGWRTTAEALTSSLAQSHRAAVTRGGGAGKTAPLWKALTVSNHTGAVHTWGAGRGPGVRHFVTEIYALRDSRVELRLGVSGAAVASLDGQMLGELPAAAFPAPDQVSLKLKLSEGVHHLMVSVATEAGAPCRMFARLVDSNGRRPLFIDERRPEGGWPSFEPGAASGAPQMEVIRDAIAPGRGFNQRLRAAAVRRALGLPEPASTASGLRLEELVEHTDYRSAPALLAALAANLVQGDHHRMAALDALAQLKRSSWVKPMAAMVAMDREQLWRASDLLRERPQTEATAAVARARLALLRGRPALASSILSNLPGDAPPSTDLLYAHFETALSLGRPDVALPALRSLQVSNPYDASLRAQLSDLHLDLGQDAEAMKVLLEVPSEHPSVEPLRLQAAQIAVRRGERDVAIALMNELAARTASVELMVSLARLFAEVELHDRAESMWTRVLELRPGDPELREEWERSQPAAQAETPFVYQASELIAAYPTPSGSGPLEILADETHIDVKVDGGWRRYDQRVLRVLRPPESRGGRTSTLRFDPSRQQARVLRAEVLRAGRTTPVASRELYQVTDDSAGFYYDLQELAVVFDDLQVGDVVTIQQRLDSGPQPGLPGSFGLVHSVHEVLPKRRLHVTVSADADSEISVAMRRGSGSISPGALNLTEETLANGRRRWTLEGADLAPLVMEPDSVVLEERSATLYVSTHRSWSDIVSEYSKLIERSRVITPAMRNWVAERRAALGPAAADEAGVALARDLAVSLARRVRYVGLEFGEHSYRPYGTDQVWSRRFGDCKDQSNLLVALLSLAGIEAHIALVRTRPHGRVDEPVPSFAVFDHAIVYLPQWDLFFDPTSPYHGWGDLPPVDQGAQALVIRPEAPQLVRLPMGKPARNGVRGSYIITLGHEGAANLTGQAEFLGSLAASYRDRLTDESARAERLEELLNGRYPGLELLSNELVGLEASASSLTMKIQARVPSLAASASDGLEVRRPAGLDGFASRWASLARRSTTLRLPTPSRHELRFQYVLPAGWRVSALPPEVKERGEFGAYSVSWTQDAGSVSVDNRFELSAEEISAEDYEGFRAFLERYDAALRVPLALQRPGGGAP